MSWRTGPVTLTMLAICWVVFAFDFIVTAGNQPSGPLVVAGQIVPSLIQAGQWWRIITAGFLHYGIMGVFGAMAVLGFKLPHARNVLLQSALFPIVLTFGYVLTNPNISNAGHLGGLIGGVLIASVMTPDRAAMLRGEQDA
jgi:membrane associated rhomboid family serine protease